MTKILRLLLPLSILVCLAGLLMAADEKQPRIIIASPSVFDPSECHPLLSAISPDGKYVAYSPDTKGLINPKLHLCDAVTKKVLHRLDIWNGACFTPDSTRLLCEWHQEDPNNSSAILCRQIDVYDVKTGKRLREIRLKAGQPGGGGDNFGGPCFVFNDDLAVVAGTNEVATIYNLKTGKALGDLPTNNRAFFMALSRDGRWLLTADQKNGILHTWDVKARKHDRLLYEYVGLVQSVAISPDGRWCAVGTRRGVKVFDRTTGGEKTEGRIGLANATAIAFSPNGKRIIASGQRRILSPGELDFGLRFWDWQTENPPSTVICPITPSMTKAWRHMGRFHSRLMSDDGNRFLSVGGGGGHLLLDLKNPNPPPDWEPDPEPEPEPKAKDGK